MVHDLGGISVTFIFRYSIKLANKYGYDHEVITICHHDRGHNDLTKWKVLETGRGLSFTPVAGSIFGWLSQTHFSKSRGNMGRCFN